MYMNNLGKEQKKLCSQILVLVRVILAGKAVVNLFSSREFVTLSGKPVGNCICHVIVEIIAMGQGAGGLVQVVPAALLVEAPEKVSTIFIESIRKSDAHFRENVV